MVYYIIYFKYIFNFFIFLKIFEIRWAVKVNVKKSNVKYLEMKEILIEPSRSSGPLHFSAIGHGRETGLSGFNTQAPSAQDPVTRRRLSTSPHGLCSVGQPNSGIQACPQKTCPIKSWSGRLLRVSLCVAWQRHKPRDDQEAPCQIKIMSTLHLMLRGTK
jgi:hypothetical protein